jgi:hypothetical protein
MTDRTTSPHDAPPDGPALGGAQRVGRRAALAGAGAVGLVGAILGALHGAWPSFARAEARRDESRPRSEDPPSRARREHALRPLEGPALEALRACEVAGVRLVRAYAPRHGGLPFVVEIRRGHPDVGARRTFELLRSDPAGDPPLATLGALALVLENRGDGRTPTQEEDARLALRLASALASRTGELEGLALTTARERRARAPFATLHVPAEPGF